MKIIGITGPTGAGKSTVCKELLRFNYNVIDADKIAKDILKKNIDCKNKLVSFFGEGILDENNNIIRKKLAKIAFLNAKNTEMLNKITHPLIIEEIRAIISILKSKGNRIVFLDVPLLFETGLDKFCDFTVAVIADEDTRRQRLIKRDNIDEKLINMRISAQNKNDYYKKCADYILINDGDKKDLNLKIAEMLNNIIGENR